MEGANSLIEQRRAKLAALRAKGIDPFRTKFTPVETCAEARARYAEGREVALAGRITALFNQRIGPLHIGQLFNRTPISFKAADCLPLAAELSGLPLRYRLRNGA